MPLEQPAQVKAMASIGHRMKSAAPHCCLPRSYEAQNWLRELFCWLQREEKRGAFVCARALRASAVGGRTRARVKILKSGPTDVTHDGERGAAVVGPWVVELASASS